jgi:hypothetical protein
MEAGAEREASAKAAARDCNASSTTPAAAKKWVLMRASVDERRKERARYSVFFLVDPRRARRKRTTSLF